ncbi:MAG: DUF4388 domain-containing protein [Acidimicrobiales bacterium]
MLQGSLENFALDEVLGLLSGTSKTGQLEIAGNRGTGSLLFDDGRLVDGTASYTANGGELEDVMFELLRYDDGTFTFTSREVTGNENPENVASVLASAENRLRDWRSIEAVVPTLSHQVAPSVDLPAEEVTITRAEWAALTVIAAGCPVSLVCDRLELGEVEGSRRIKDLAERSLIEVSEPIGGFSSAYRASAPTPAPAETAPSAMAQAAADNSENGFTADAVASPAFDSPAFDSSSFEVAALDSTADVEAVAAVDETSELATASSDSVLGTLMGEQRPPMPPIPVPDDFEAEQTFSPAASVPAPPSPAEISSFGEGLEDASELVETADEGKSGGLLARYLKSDD